MSNVLYLVWTCFYALLSGNSLTITPNVIIDFLVFNESPLGGHLWYLGAILYTLISVRMVQSFGNIKHLYYLIPILLLGDLILGKYAILILGREFPYIIARNWLFVGIPFFSIGMLMREKKFRIGWWGIPVFALTTILER